MVTPPAAITWRCHTCRQTITTLVPLVEPPTCNGNWRHRPIPMCPDNDPTPESEMTRPQ